MLEMTRLSERNTERNVAMLMRNLRWSLMVLAVLVLTADRAWALGFILGETKEELKLQYDVTVDDHGNGRMTVVFTLADEGRLKPVDAVELSIPAQEKNKDGGYSSDLSVPMELQKSSDGKRVARFEIRKDWAERAEIWLTTNSFDGKPLVTTRYHYMIPVAKSLKTPPAATAQPAGAPAAAPAAAAPPATERKKD
jgi:hypothetical protein